MKFSKLSLTFVLALSVVGANTSFAKTASKKTKKTVEKVLTKDKALLSDPYYQIKVSSIRELSEAESYMYESGISEFVGNKSLTLPAEVKGNGFKIPGGVPGVEEGGIVGDNSKDSNSGVISKPAVNKGGSSNASAGGLAVGTGAGGNTSGGVMGTVTSVLDGAIMVIDKLVAIGEKIMPTIEKGRPAVSSKSMQAISVLPRIDAKDPVVHDMGNWSIPTTKHYRISYSNGLGGNAASFIYSITYQYGGTYGGKGKYLAGVRAAAQDIQVNWGFDLDATSQLIQISNVGTAENVVAGATIEITYTVKNVMRVLSTSESFFVAGDGRLYKLD